MFNISNGHLYKNEPFDAANFGLKSSNKRSTFLGNVGVTIHTPNMDDQYRYVDIMIPVAKAQVNMKCSYDPSLKKICCKHSDEFKALKRSSC